MQDNKRESIRVLSLFLCLLFMFLTTCNSPTAITQVLRCPMGSEDFQSLDPALAQTISDVYAVQTVFTGLVQFKDNGTIVDQLAASHSVSADGLTYTFILKSGLKFSDGNALSSRDVAYSINRALLPATKSSTTGYLSLIKDYDEITTGKIPTIIGDSLLIPNDSTISIVLSKPAAYFLQALTYPVSYVVEQKLIDTYHTAWTDHLDEGGGDGPFKVSHYSHTTGLELVPNLDYYGARPQLQKLQLLISGSEDTMYRAYLANQYDMTPVPAADIAEAKSRHDYKEFPELITEFVTMNYLAKPFDNIKIRQAFALAIDKDLLAKTTLRGSVIPTNHIVPSGMVGYNQKLVGPDRETSTQGDKTKAQQLLMDGMHEAGYSNVAALPPIEFYYATGDPTISDLAVAIAQQWQTILGVRVETIPVESNTLLQWVFSTKGHSGPLQMWLTQWQADYPDPQDWLSLFFGNNADLNINNYGQNNSDTASEQQMVQQQLALADVNQDMHARIQAYNDAEQKVVNDVGWIPLYQPQGQRLLNPRVRGYVFNALGITTPDDWANIYIA